MVRQKTLLILASCLLIYGCGASPSDTPETGNVEGVVTLNEVPLQNARVVFQPEKGRPSEGTTDEQGHYVLKYSSDINGAKIGNHVVRITTGTNITQDDGTIKKIPELVPAKYNKKSELKAEVKADNEPFNFDLTSE